MITAASVLLRLPDDLRKAYLSGTLGFGIDTLELMIQEAASIYADIITRCEGSTILWLISEYVTAKSYERVGNLDLAMHHWNNVNEFVEKVKLELIKDKQVVVKSDERIITEEDFERW